MLIVNVSSPGLWLIVSVVFVVFVVFSWVLSEVFVLFTILLGCRVE